MKPILFNTLMTSAVDKEIKTMTRRVVKDSIPLLATVSCIKRNWYWSFWQDGDYHRIKQPYEVGDILYVRETWQNVYLESIKDGIARVCYPSPRGGYNLNYYIKNWGDIPKVSVPDEDNSFYIYRATNLQTLRGYQSEPCWRPAIHMPKSAARIFLRVKSIRIEKLQDITEDDAFREGAQTTATFQSTRDVFIHIWTMTVPENKQGTDSWDANPWVWVIEFEKVTKEDITSL